MMGNCRLLKNEYQEFRSAYEVKGGNLYIFHSLWVSLKRFLQLNPTWLGRKKSGRITRSVRVSIIRTGLDLVSKTTMDGAVELYLLVLYFSCGRIVEAVAAAVTLKIVS